MLNPDRASRVKLNIVANFGGQFWTALMGFIFVPLYISFMGIEAYGVVGLCAALTAVFLVLDFGLSTTVVREMARLSGGTGNEQDLRDLLRTLEWVYWSAAFLISIIVFSASHWVAYRWVKPEDLAASDVRQAVIIMGVALACRWPFALYSGGLRGLQRQVTLNWIIGISTTLRGVGAVLVLWLISPTVQAFLVWQIVTDCWQTVLSAVFLWRKLPAGPRRPVFRTDLLVGVWRFSAAIGAAVVLYTITLQMDKIFLSTVLSLETFGYYALASVAAAALLKPLAPIESALFPRFSELMSQGNRRGLESLYHKSCQMVTVATMPLAIVTAVFSKQILMAWTGDFTTTENAYLVLSVLAVGTGLHASTGLPYSLQFAHGWTSLSLAMNLASAISILPLLWALTEDFGPPGAAMAWVILNVAAFVIMIQIMHRRLLIGQQWAWYVYDVGLPSLAALSVACGAAWWTPETTSRVESAVFVIATLCLAVAAAALVAPEMRRLLISLTAKLMIHAP